MTWHWPWVSRLAFEVVVDERDRLRADNARLIDHAIRRDRTEHRMPETPRPPRPAPDAMPTRLVAYLDGYANESLRADLRDKLIRRNQGGDSWEKIIGETIPADNDGGGSA